jgi:hypothetical protein
MSQLKKLAKLWMIIPEIMSSRSIFKVKGFLKAIEISINRIIPNNILPK